MSSVQLPSDVCVATHVINMCLVHACFKHVLSNETCRARRAPRTTRLLSTMRRIPSRSPRWAATPFPSRRRRRPDCDTQCDRFGVCATESILGELGMFPQGSSALPINSSPNLQRLGLPSVLRLHQGWATRIQAVLGQSVRRARCACVWPCPGRWRMSVLEKVWTAYGPSRSSGPLRRPCHGLAKETIQEVPQGCADLEAARHLKGVEGLPGPSPILV